MRLSLFDMMKIYGGPKVEHFKKFVTNVCDDILSGHVGFNVGTVC